MQTNSVPAKQSTSTDLMIRFLHVVMLLSFTGAYLTGDAEESHQLHMAFGYTLGISLALRIVWQVLSMLNSTQPTGISKRLGMIQQFVKRDWKQPQQFFSLQFLKSVSSSAFQFSILLIWLALPLTVLAGFFTDYTQSHTLKEVHEFAANLFLAAVLMHLASLTLSSVLFKKWLAKTMFWGSGKPAVLTILIWMISVASLAGFWWWYWQ